MKTPEEMAEEWVGRNRSYPYRPEGSTDKCVKAAFLAGYKAAQEWISVEDRLPEPGTRVIVFDATIPDFPRTNTKVVIGHLRGHDRPFFINAWFAPDGLGHVTHWMPLPPAPKEEP